MALAAADRRGSMNAPLGHVVQVIQHEPLDKPTSTQRIRAVLDELMDKRPIEPPQ